MLEKTMLRKLVGVLGPGKDDEKVARVLNRIIRCAEILRGTLVPSRERTRPPGSSRPNTITPSWSRALRRWRAPRLRWRRANSGSSLRWLCTNSGRCMRIITLGEEEGAAWMERCDHGGSRRLQSPPRPPRPRGHPIASGEDEEDHEFEEGVSGTLSLHDAGLCRAAAARANLLALIGQTFGFLASTCWLQTLRLYCLGCHGAGAPLRVFLDMMPV